MEPWAISKDAVLAHFHVKDVAHGLSEKQVEEQRAIFGRNEFDEKEGVCLFREGFLFFVLLVCF